MSNFYPLIPLATLPGYTTNLQPNGQVTVSRPNGRVISVQPDGSIQDRPAGTAAAYELATPTDKGFVYQVEPGAPLFLLPGVSV